MPEANQALSTDAWTKAEAKPISVEELDAIARECRSKRDAYEIAKSKSTDLYKIYEEAEGQLLTAMQQAGKRKYHVEGLGLFYFIEKLVVTTPETNEAKAKFFDWLRDKFGPTFLLDKQSINHQSLQKIYNDAYNEAKEAGSADTFAVPGLETPTANIDIGFRGEKNG